MQKSNFRSPSVQYQLSTETRGPSTPAIARHVAMQLAGKWT